MVARSRRPIFPATKGRMEGEKKAGGRKGYDKVSPSRIWSKERKRGFGKGRWQ